MLVILLLHTNNCVYHAIYLYLVLTYKFLSAHQTIFSAYFEKPLTFKYLATCTEFLAVFMNNLH